ncbi:MAG: phosphotransferase [Alphaproteobacteria bacterium]|nr:phosphotransferase [Alphaproteobacteria bacterium]
MLPPSTLLTTFSVVNPRHVTETPIASIWRVTRSDGSLAVLKIYKGDNLQDEAPGFDFLAAQNGQGAAHLYARLGAAVLMEWLDGPLLGDLTRAGRDVEASQELMETANRLHQAPIRKIESLDPLTNRFRALIDARFAGDCPRRTEATIRKAIDLATQLLAKQSNVRPLHGDLHHDNIKGSSRGYLAFDAKGVLGELTYELANAFRNPLGSEALSGQPETILRRAAIWSAGLNVSQDHLLSWAAAYSALSLSWTHKGLFGTSSAKDVEFIDTIFSLLSQGPDPGP